MMMLEGLETLRPTHCRRVAPRVMRWALVLLLPAAAASCSRDATRVGFEWHLMPRGGDVHGLPSDRDSTTITAGPGTIRAVGRMPLEVDCPRLEADVERDRRSVKIHVLARPPELERGRVCAQGEEPAMGEYTVLLRGLQPGVYRVRIAHAQEVPRAAPGQAASDSRTRHSEAWVADKNVQVSRGPR